MKSKKLIIGTIAGVLLAAGAFSALTLPRMFTSTAEATVAPVVQSAPRTTAEGALVPSRSAALSLPVSGRVAEVLVSEGQAVEAGALLAVVA